MRSLPAIILAALTTVAIAVSALLTASHFGMRDWPTPPMPDTATRLITTTEAAGRARDRIARSGDAVDVKVTVDVGAGDTRRDERRVQTGASRRAERTPRGGSGRGERGGRRSGGRRSGSRGHEDRNPATDSDGATTPVAPEPSTPAPAQAAPLTGASSGDDVQARPDAPATPPPAPAPIVPDVVVPEPPTAPTTGDGEHDDEGAGHGHGNGHRPGRGRRRGPIRNLLDQLR